MDLVSFRSDASILSIGDMILYAFGDPDNNVVDHKLIQAILYLLARQLKLLERRVVVEIRGGMPLATGAGLTISEVKLHAMQPSIMKSLKEFVRIDSDKSSSSGSRVGGSDTSAGKGGISAKLSRDKRANADKAGVIASASTDARRPGARRTSKDSDTKIPEESIQLKKKEPRGKRVSLTDEDRPASDKSVVDIKTRDTDILSREVSEMGKQPSDKTIPEGTTDSIDPEKARVEGAADQGSDDKSISSDLTPSEKSSSVKLIAEGGKGETTPAKTPPSKKADTRAKARKKEEEHEEHMETLEEQIEKELRVIHQRADSREEQDKSPTPMASLHSIERGKLLIVEPKTPEDQADKGRGAAARTPKLSIVTQEQFAKLATVVRQLQNKFAPSPSPDSADNAKIMDDLRRGASLTDGRAALQLSGRLEAAEKALKQMGSLVNDLATQTPGINLKEFQEILTQGYDGTEVIFEAPGTRSQSTGGKSKKGETLGRGAGRRIEPDNLDQDHVSMAGTQGADGTRVGQKADGIRGEQGADYTQGGTRADGIRGGQGAGTLISKSTTGNAGSRSGGAMMLEKSPSRDSIDADAQYEDEYVDTTADVKDKVTYEELDGALQSMFDDVMKQLQAITNRSNANANNAYKIANKLEGKVNSSLNLGNKMYDLDKLVSDYAEQINRLDTGISSQMTDYQDQLTQMQHDLELGLETLAEVLGNPTGDPVAVAELNARFTNLQGDIDLTMQRQRVLKENQKIMTLDLEALRAQIEILRDNKSDRDEVADALQDKVGLGALNGLVTQQQFNAVRGDLEKRIAAAYDEFNGQEVIWQKTIDDLVRELNEKCDIIQVSSLKDEISKHIKILRYRIDAIKEIVGEPRVNTLMKKIHLDSDCLSCATPAHMDLKEPGLVPALPAARPHEIGESRPPAIGAEAPSMLGTVGTKGDGCRPCYAGFPIPHARDPRAHICQRYCGGSHTVVVSNALSRAPPGVALTALRRPNTTEVGTDGKTYVVDEQDMRPCLPCNVPKHTTTRQSATKEVAVKATESDVTPMDFPYRESSFGIVITAQEETFSVAPEQSV